MTIKEFTEHLNLYPQNTKLEFVDERTRILIIKEDPLSITYQPNAELLTIDVEIVY